MITPQSANRTTKTRTAKTPVWKLFHVITLDQAQCKLCSAIIATTGGNTTGLNRHVQRFHPVELREVGDRLFEDQESQSTPSQPTFSTPRQPKQGPARLLALAFSTSGIPFSLLQNTYFKQFLKQIGSTGISKEKVKNELWTMADTANKSSQFLLHNRENLVLVYDKWVSEHSDVAVISVFLVHVDAHFRKNTTFIGCRPVKNSEATSDRLMNEVVACVNSIGVQMHQITRIVSDDPLEIQTFCSFYKLTHSKCMVRVLARLIQTVMEAIDLKSIVVKAREVVVFLNENESANASFRQHVSVLNLDASGLRVYPHSRHDGSDFLLVKAYMSTTKALASMRHGLNLDPTNREKVIGTDCIDLLDEIHSLKCRFEQDESTASSVIPNLIAISQHLDRHRLRETALGNVVRAEFELHTSDLVRDVELQLLCFADPRFAFFDGAMGSTSWESVESIFVERYGDHGSRSSARTPNAALEAPPAKKAKVSALESFMSQKTELSDGNSEMKSEVVKYRYHLQLGGRPSANDDPLEFWIRNETKFPHLAKICRDLLAVPSSGSATYKVFASSGHSVCNLQCAETPTETLNAALLVNVKSKLLNFRMNSKMFIEEELCSQRSVDPTGSSSPPPQQHQEEEFQEEFQMNAKEEQGMQAVVKQENCYF